MVFGLQDFWSDFLCVLLFFLCLARCLCFDVVLGDGGASNAECHELLGDMLTVSAVVFYML